MLWYTIPLVASGLVGGVAQGAAMGYWAWTNMFQTGRISEQNQYNRDLGYAELEAQNRYLDIREAELYSQAGYQQQQSQWQLWDRTQGMFGISDSRYDIDDYAAQQSIYQQNAIERINLEAALQGQRDSAYYERQLLLAQQDAAIQQSLQQQGFTNQLALADVYNEQNLWRDDLNHQRNLAQTSLIHASDTMLQDQRLNVTTQLQQIELAQEQQEYNNYLQERMYKEQSSFARQYGNETDVGKLTYILIKLRDQLPKHYMHNSYAVQHADSNPVGNAEFDYALWHEVPDERIIP